MNRAELRRTEKEQHKKTKTYTLTQEQITDLKETAVKEAVEKAFTLMLALPLEVLITEEYWMKSAKKRMPKFIEDVLRVYRGYQNGAISIEEMEKDLWDFAGIKVTRDTVHK